MGARGSVATTAMVGASALRDGLIPPVGCVTELPQLSSPALPAWHDLVLGGHDVVAGSLPKSADELASAGVLPAAIVTALGDQLAALDDEIHMLSIADTPAATVRAIAADVTAFRRRHHLDRVVVVNVATTEAWPEPHPTHADLASFEKALHDTRGVLPPSVLAAYAAFTAGCSFVDFTPSIGARLPALAEFAEQQGVPFTGNDGKTGETLVKSVLAPMFAMRRLQVLSWSGVNLLGGGDGASLAEAPRGAAKIASKQRVLGDVLGYQPPGDSRIDYVEPLGDFKTAWDLVTFAGFLGTRMRLDFTWHGCDSALAAPLVLDLARLTSAAHAAGRSGPLPELGFFFKDPVGTGPAALSEQFPELVTFVTGLDGAR